MKGRVTMDPRLRRLLSCCMAIASVIALTGCVASFDDSLTPLALKGANAGVVFMKVTYVGNPCRVGNVALATEPSPGRYVLHSAPMLGGINASGLNSRQISLPAGTYHVGYVQCMLDDGGKTAVLGETDATIQIGNPRQSFAHFTVSAGEVVNLGQINFVPTDHLANASTISITDIDAATMGRLRSSLPTLAPVMVTRLMAETQPGQSFKISWTQMGGG